jgi:hypothetical protein
MLNVVMQSVVAPVGTYNNKTFLKKLFTFVIIRQYLNKDRKKFYKSKPSLLTEATSQWTNGLLQKCQ